MKHLLRILTIVMVMLVVARGKETAVATHQTLTGQDALNFLRESGIYNQISPAEKGGGSPVGREFFQTAQIGASDGYTDDLFGISVARDGDTVLIGVNQADIDGNVDQGAAYVFKAFGDNNWGQEAKLTAGDGAAGDLFGFAVALEGDTAVIGAYQADIGSSGNQGAAYVFNRSGVFWSQGPKLTADSGSAGDAFGYAVAFDGSAALIGAPSEDVGGNVDQGAAYVFGNNGGSWSQQARLVTADTQAGDGFGRAVALDGGAALIGAPFEDIGFDQNQGAAYVFTNNNGSWSQEARLVTSFGGADDEFGGAVALDNDTALIGAHLVDVNGNSNQGAAYVFTRSGGSWSQQDVLSAVGGAAADRFGRSVAVEGDTALIGAPRTDINGNGNQGAAYVFIREDEDWSQQGKLTDWTNGEGGDRFGRSVALDGDTALVGAIYSELWFGNSDRGAVYAYARSEVAWLPVGEAVAQDGEENDFFGYAVAIDGDTILVGTPQATVDGNQYQGAAYIFERSMGSWVQTAELTDMEFDEWLFGSSVALEGDIAAIGAPGTNSIVDLGGAVYIFVRESDNNWVLYETLTTSIREPHSQFGYSVAIDGETVLVGAPGKDINGNLDQGAAYIFIRETNSSWVQQAGILAVDGVQQDGFGISVALDSDMALVGAIYAEVNGNDAQGAAYLFTQVGDSWSHQAKLIAADGAEGDLFGYPVVLDADTALAGAFADDVNNNDDQGSLYVFSRTNGSWSQQDKLTASDGASGDNFGFSAAFDGNTVLVGAYEANVGANINQGAVYVFVRSGNEWRQQAKLTAADGITFDEFGRAVALQGNMVLIGAPRADVNGNDDQGKVYFFQRQPYEIFLPLVLEHKLLHSHLHLAQDFPTPAVPAGASVQADDELLPKQHPVPADLFGQCISVCPTLGQTVIFKPAAVPIIPFCR